MEPSFQIVRTSLMAQKDVSESSSIGEFVDRIVRSNLLRSTTTAVTEEILKRTSGEFCLESIYILNFSCKGELL